MSYQRQVPSSPGGELGCTNVCVFRSFWGWSHCILMPNLDTHCRKSIVVPMAKFPFAQAQQTPRWCLDFMQQLHTQSAGGRAAAQDTFLASLCFLLPVRQRELRHKHHPRLTAHEVCMDVTKIASLESPQPACHALVLHASVQIASRCGLGEVCSQEQTPQGGSSHLALWDRILGRHHSSLGWPLMGVVMSFGWPWEKKGRFTSHSAGMKEPAGCWVPVEFISIPSTLGDTIGENNPPGSEVNRKKAAALASAPAEGPRGVPWGQGDGS